jgi:hypothetical protein
MRGFWADERVELAALGSELSQPRGTGDQAAQAPPLLFTSGEENLAFLLHDGAGDADREAMTGRPQAKYWMRLKLLCLARTAGRAAA